MGLTNNALERATLAALCQYGIDFYVEVDFLTVEHFTQDVNKLLFPCIRSVLSSNEVIDLTSIFSSAQSLGVYDLISKTSELTYVRSLFNFPVDRENAPKFAAKLSKLTIARKLSAQLRNCADRVEQITGDEKLEDILALAENPIMEITASAYKDTSNVPVLIGEGIQEYVEYLAENPTDYLGIPTGMKRFDEAIGGGLRRRTVTLIGARTGIGKSVIATNVGKYVALTCRMPVLYLDTEMDITDQQNRMLANLSGVKINDIARGYFAKKMMPRKQVELAAKTLESIPFHHISVAGQSFDGILNIIKRWLHQHVGVDEAGRTKDCLIIYDYFKLMSSAGLTAAMQEYQALGFQVTKMSDFCITHDIPCLSFVQLNRENEIAQSDRLQWLASTVAKFEAKSPEELGDDGEENGNRKIVIVKARHGSGLEQGDYINVKMHGATAHLEEWYTRNELKNGVNVSQNPQTFDQIGTGTDLFDPKSDQ